jgi:hypothetical protein
VNLGQYYDRDVLYEEVWAEPVEAVAKRYGVSGVALAKTCRRLHVPLPGRGYWAKKAHGQSPPKPPLPDFTNPPRIARRHVWQQHREAESPTRLRPDVYDAAQKLIRAELSPENMIAVSEEHDHYPPLVEAARSRCWKPGIPYGNPQRPPEPPKPTRRCFDICVSTVQAERAFRLMTALSQALEKRGFSVAPGEFRSDSWPTLVSILGTQVAFSLTESHKRRTLDEHERKQRSYEYYVWESTGVFTLEIAGLGYGRGRSRWNDTRRKPLERQLNAFVAGLIEAAATKVETAAQRDRERKRQLVDSDARRRRSYRNQRESVRIAAIEQGAEQWEHYLRVIRYIAAVEQATPDPGLSEVEEVRRAAWLRWAREYADRCNPLRTGHPTLRVESTEIEKHDPGWFRTEYPRLRDSGLVRPTIRDAAR